MNTPMNANRPLKLHLGCGEKYLEGYVNIDFPEGEHTVMKPKVDRYADVRTLTYPENSVDEIRNHHLLEHFPRAEALVLLLRWRRWLKPGGRLMIETPDFLASASAYASALTRRRKMQLGRHIFGSQEATWAYHYDFWDREKFKFVLGKLGFRRIRVKTYYNRLAQHFPNIPFINVVGNWVPDYFFHKYGGHKLPNILVVAEKDGSFMLDEKDAARAILSQYLVGRDGDALLNVWLEQFKRASDTQPEKDSSK